MSGVEEQLRDLVARGAQLLGLSLVRERPEGEGDVCADCGEPIAPEAGSGHLVHLDTGVHGCRYGPGCAHRSEYFLEFIPTTQPKRRSTT